MPDDEKPVGEAASSDQEPVAAPSQPAVETRPAGGAEKPPTEVAAEKSAAGAEQPTAVEKAPPAAKPAPKTDAAEPAAKPAAKPVEKPAAKKAPASMAVTPWEGPLVDRLRERFGEEITEFSSYKGDDFLVAKLPGAFPILQYLKADEGFDYLVDVTATHYPEKEKPFEVFWILYSHPHNVRIRVKAEVAEGETPRSADSLYATANWLEREVYDMFGVAFADHPNMTRILLPDEWQGHPLRKDYSIIQQDQDWVRENLNIESGQ